MTEPLEPKVAPLQLGESALRELVDAAFDALVITRAGLVLFANRSFCEMGGWKRDEVIGRSVIEFVAPNYRAEVIEKLRSGGESRYEAKGLRGDGTLVDVEICARECVYEGEPARITAIRYIDDRKRAEEALRRSEARFREVFERLPDMIAVHSGGIVSFANPAIVSYLGYSTMADLVGRPVNDFVHPDDRHAVLERMSVTWKMRAPAPLSSYRTLRRDGTSGVVEAASAPIEFDGEPAVLIIMRDVAERKQMEVRLMQAELLASVGMLAAGITHEINNPLAYILLNLDVLARRLSVLLANAGAPEPIAPPAVADDEQTRAAADALASEIQHLVTETRDGAARVKQIVHDFRVFARGGDGRPRTLDVRDVLESTVKLVLNELRHRARLVRDYGPVPMVRADEARLGQLFLNLLINAIQALPEGGGPEEHEIRVATRTSTDGSAVVDVADTGVGIPGDVVGRVFEPFFSTKHAGLGSGLGLSICQSIVSALGGRIELKSESGRGALFRVTLPAAPADSAAQEDVAAPARCARAQGYRILLVDDEEKLLNVLARELSHDYVVEDVSSGDAAIRCLLDRPYDVVVCDLMMPGTSGADVYDAVRRQRPELAPRFVFMTGGAFTARTRRFLERVPNPRLEKPFEMHELRAVLDELFKGT